jgi:hypothetical protein
VSTTSPKRTTPLSAQAVPADAVTTNGDTAPADDRRQQRFVDGVRQLRVGGGRLALGERTLMVVGGVLAPLGLIVVLLGYWGAARTPFLFEQVPYLISGGLFGLGLVFLGSFFYFTHWLTQLVKEHRIQSVAMVEALQRLQDEVARGRDGQVGTVAAAALGPDGLVATARGTMAHRPDCVVVAGKRDLHEVTPADGLLSCKLCEPYEP